MLLPAHAGAEEPSLILMTRPIDEAEWLIRQPDSAYTIQLLTGFLSRAGEGICGRRTGSSLG